MKKILVLSNSTPHKTSKMKDKIKECETVLSVIPNGLKRILRSLSISINKVFKESIRNKYVNYWIGKTI